MDTYQPIYDAVRSRLSNGDIGAAVESAMREANLSHYISVVANVAMERLGEVAREQMRPSVLHRATLAQEGAGWRATLGAFNACGDTPAAAMAAFDRTWLAPQKAG